MQNTTALITGASSGIGRDLAIEFARHGHNLILVARSENLLLELAKELHQQYQVSAHILALDLSLPDSAQKLFFEVKELGIAVDILVNNAGFGELGDFAKMDVSRIEQMMNLNMNTLALSCRLFLPAMLGKKSGKILNVASTAAFQAGPGMSVYYATKAFVLHFSEGISYELRRSGVSVTALCPGATPTNFGKEAKALDSLLFKVQASMSSQKVAEIGYEALMDEKPMVIAGRLNWLMAFSVRFSPRWLLRSIVARLHR